jgi:hypothetical protein
MDFRACCISLCGGLYAYPMGKHILTQPQVRSSVALLLFRSRASLVNCLRQTHTFEKPRGLQTHSVAFCDGTRSESTTEPKSQRGTRRAYYFDFCLFNTPGRAHRSSLKLDPMRSTSVSLWPDGYSSSHYAALLLEVRHGLTTKLPG